MDRVYVLLFTDKTEALAPYVEQTKFKTQKTLHFPHAFVSLMHGKLAALFLLT